MEYLSSQSRYGTMPYKRCGKSGLKLPAISFGLWHNYGGVDIFENGRAMIHRLFDLGITHFWGCVINHSFTGRAKLLLENIAHGSLPLLVSSLSESPLFRKLFARAQSDFLIAIVGARL